MNIYHAQLIDHYRNPRNKGIIASPTFTGRADNPLCGDSVTIQAIVTDDCITHVAFDGFGCVLSQATASLLTVCLKDKSISEVEQITKERVQDLAHINVGPTRLKCVLLVWHALQEGLKQIQ